MKFPCFCALMASFSVLVVGCDRSPAPAAGGTSGTLKFGDQVTSDIMITIHRKSNGAFESIGFGTTQSDGTFVLYKPGAAEPLYLAPGDYCGTLESVGPPVRLPQEYLDPSQSPMTFAWALESDTLNLNAPQMILMP